MGKNLSVLLLLVFVGCGGGKKSEADLAPPSETSVESTPQTHEPMTFEFELLQQGEVVSRPTVTTLPGRQFQVSTDEHEFNLQFERSELGMRLYGEWTGGEIAAVDGPLGTRLKVVVDPERGIELVVTARKHHPEPPSEPSQ